MNIEALLAEFKAIKSAHEAGTITSEQSVRLVALPAEIKAAQVEAKAIADGEAILAGIDAAGPGVKNDEDAPVRTLGEHFVKAAAGRSIAAGVEAAEFKAAADPTLVGDSQINDVDRTVVGQTRQRPTVAALLASGTVTGNGVTYRVELPVEGTIAAVAEGDAKARVQYRYEEKREGISTVAGFTEISDDMADDLPYVASEINGNLLVDLDIEEDRQLLNGDGVGPNPLGILNRSGVQVVAAANVTDNLDAIHRAGTLVSIGSNREATALVIHPLDYEKLVLSKDDKGSYLGAGPFVATVSKGIWAIPAVVTTAIAQGTALVGAYDAATLLRKGGVKVKSTDSHDGNFIKGITTIVGEKRVGLKVGKPAAFAKITFSTAPAA